MIAALWFSAGLAYGAFAQLAYGAFAQLAFDRVAAATPEQRKRKPLFWFTLALASALWPVGVLIATIQIRGRR